ncbi:hypothetical protein V1L54_07935 [Streptomyces sp. TRM 70361]|uniref:hypothetical protein n=1 Tax=Streptomyces sp. TRM 70361 TaxID=3116553 RepID=UPI002E7B5A07|nr:hypothetical protein [Streptomyces sp. TRM 70361]MEE1939343.1 hypothetical protein [Streptomyces sp. TRM 70361]
MSEETPFEAQLRRMLAEGVDDVRPESAPYDAIVRGARSARRRGMAVAGAGVAVLAVVPGVALGAYGGWGDGSAPAAGAAPASSGAPDSPGASAGADEPEGMGPPATSGQLADGIGLSQAEASFARCLKSHAALQKELPGDASPAGGLGDPADYRLLQAWRLVANHNEGTSGTGVLAVHREDDGAVYFCRDRKETQNLRVFNGDGAPERAVTVDINANVLYRQIPLGGTDWELPYRWVDYGSVTSEVSRVTVEYGGRTVEATIDDGYFVASGVLTEKPDAAPAIKGYDADGTLVYDSAEDRYYEAIID